MNTPSWQENWKSETTMWTHTIPYDQFRCITLACTLATRLKYCSGTRTQHDLARLNKLILVSERELNNLTHGYKLQISKTVSLFKWIESSLLYAITCTFQPNLKQSTFSTLWLLSKNIHKFELHFPTCFWK
jgi:hypothetical protein